MRYTLKISYDGTNYSGYQRQKNKMSIQEIIENALAKVFKQELCIVASGRTDAGVSAIEQVCHLDYDGDMNPIRMTGYINTLLPLDIRVLSIVESDDGFHARYSAKKKTYEYLFYLGREDIPVLSNIASRISFDLNIEEMRNACKYFIGEHDFSSFCASNTSIKDKTRTIYDMDIVEIDENLYKLVVTGNGFLYNMVRIIMGTLTSVGVGKIRSEDIKDIISSKDRSKAGKTAESKGLYLKKVTY